MMKPLLFLALPLALLACSREQAPPPPPPSDTITPALQGLAEKAKPGILAAMVLEDGSQARGVNMDQPMPLQSVFKLPLAIVVLDAVDKGHLALDDEVEVTQDQLSISHSPVADAFPGRTTYTIEELVRLAVAQSDNTAADILMRRVGGPEAVTAFFARRGLTTFRVDRYESELQPQAVGLPAFKGQWIGLDAYLAAQGQVPAAAQRAALRLYLADPRDRISPREAVRILASLAAGRLLSEASTAKLMEILRNTTTGTDRLKAGLPRGATLYHKTGTGPDVENVNSATNDVGIIELKDGRRISVAVFLAGSELDSKARAAMIAEVARIASESRAGGEAR